MNINMLEVTGLSKKYKQFAIENISFSVPQGCIMGFIGQNGAGKSTTIKCIMNLISFNSGEIKILGKDNKKSSKEIRNQIGYVSEEQYYYEDMTVEWTGNFIGRYYENWDNLHFNKLLLCLSIDKKKKIKELSKGMKVKLSLALALSHRPKLLILDEPTSGLDPVVREEILEILMDTIQDEGCSVFFSSHITSDIERIADYVTFIDRGKIILCDDKDTILQNWKLIKASNDYYDDSLRTQLLGIKKGDFGFSGITNNIESFSVLFHNTFPKGNYIKENATLDELLIRFVKDGADA